MSPTRANKSATGRKAAPAKATTTTRARNGGAAKDPVLDLPVKDGEQPWTASALAAVRAELEGEADTLRREIEIAENEVVTLMRHSGDGAGDDQADAGSKTLEREQELSLANNARELLIQNRHAVERIDDGSYGVCESCGGPIGRLRLEAAPRATLCLPCKSKEERR